MLDQAGVPVLHGPMVAADFSRGDGVDLLSFAAALGGEAYRLSSESGLRTLQPGTARGVLYGGCLSLLTASLGTRFAAQTEGKLLFLEDLAEKPYQIDRMLRQMKLAGKLEGVTRHHLWRDARLRVAGRAGRSYRTSDFAVLDWFSGSDCLSDFARDMCRAAMLRCRLAWKRSWWRICEGTELRVGPRAAGGAREAMKIEAKHIHLIGICGTAMASLAGMLQLQGTR